MATEYSAEICRKLHGKFDSLGLHRPMRISRYEPATELLYNVTAIDPSTSLGAGKPGAAQVRLVVERFVGGGFAGQVYKVKVLEIRNATGPIPAIVPGHVYAMKILVPPSGFSRLFRNLLYIVGFQGPFQLQVNPAAARAGAIWQKFIRRSAKIRLGDEKTVVDVHGTFIDETIGSCGELSEWVEGRTWRLEADDRMDLLKLWRKGRAVDTQLLASPEYRGKKEFMRRFVKLLADVGAFELARQYEWWTCKSQPNLLKRNDSGDDPTAGLVAVDFRPGLALLPFLPMSPADFKLIVTGLARGSLVQFDRGDLSKLETFVRAHRAEFADMAPMLDELKAAEQIYRNSIPDVTHNHLRLLYSRSLWSTMLDSAVTGWKVRNLADEPSGKKLRSSKFLTLLFIIVGLIPFLGKIFRRFWANAAWRRHYAAMLTGARYLARAVHGRIVEKGIDWHRNGRINAHQTVRIAQQPWRFLYHLPFLLFIFPTLHRFLTDAEFRKEKLVFIFVRPFRLYFHAPLREQWLREMVAEGRKKHMLTDDDAAAILSQINEPYIQKYLVSLVVHLMTLPVTQIVSVSLAVIYYLMHPEMPRAQVWAVAVGIIALFQAIPISPGSICRGSYVLYLVLKERNFRDYNIAVFLGFFKYIGYLAFPIQMTYRYPVLARFMASHWATEIVHIVPVFGERGALLEHWVFGLFYNWPLTIRRRMQRRAQLRSTMKPRYWHLHWLVLCSVLVLGAADFFWLRTTGRLPHLGDIWWLAILVPAACGAGVTLGCRGAALWKRIVAAAVSGALIGTLYTAISAILSYNKTGLGPAIVALWAWRTFLFALLATIAALAAELKLPDPDLKKHTHTRGLPAQHA